MTVERRRGERARVLILILISFALNDFANSIVVKFEALLDVLNIMFPVCLC